MKLMVIRPGALGDTLMLLPSFLALSSHIEATFVGRQPGLDFIRPHVKNALNMEGHGWHRLFLDSQENIRLPVSDVDRTVAFLPDENGVIGRNLQSAFPQGSVFVFPSLPSTEEKIHAAAHIAHCLKNAGLPVDSESALDEIMRYRPGGGGLQKAFPTKLVCHPGSGSRNKNHPVDFWLDLLGFMKKDSHFGGLDFHILVGPAEENLLAFFQNSPLTSSCKIVCCPDREYLLRLFEETALYIGHDSGVTHLSAMVGVPTIALFRKTDPIRWRPLGPYVRIIKDETTSRKVMERTLLASQEMLGNGRDREDRERHS